MSALLVAIMLHIIRPPAAMSPRLRVDIVFDAPRLPRHVDVVAMEEVTRIWAACGVDVRAPHADEPGRAGAVRLAVRLADREVRPVPPEPLGSVRFIDGVPEPRVALYLDAIARFVSGASLNDHPYSDWPIALQDATLGRAVGRVLAHEIGHFLLCSRDHTAKGLMRSAQILTDLVSPDWRRFALSAEGAGLLLPPSADAGRKESGVTSRKGEVRRDGSDECHSPRFSRLDRGFVAFMQTRFPGSLSTFSISLMTG
jgi:hypothetical protein